jgi:MoxR-like ATPase
LTDTGAFVANHGMSPDDFHEAIGRMVEVKDERLVVPEDLVARLEAEAGDLLIEPSLLQELSAALLAGNVVLQGPPGTGKSTLARAIAAAFNVELYPVTAHEDWSTFEVIGRQELRIDEGGNEEIVPVNGHFTEAAIRCAGNIPRHQDDPSEPQATWLLIDELNRAHPDKAFGELFSVLGTSDPVDITLPHQREGNNIMVTPQRFRIVATINSVDKQFVNSLSQGLRRRFTFLTVDVPAQKPADEDWLHGTSVAAREFRVVQSAAARRVAAALGESEQQLLDFLSEGPVQNALVGLFEILEKARYATLDSSFPFIPVGTAPIIDTIELFLIRAVQDRIDAAESGGALDWAASVKLVPLFEAGGVETARLIGLADALPSPFTSKTRSALQAVASDGLYATP